MNIGRKRLLDQLIESFRLLRKLCSERIILLPKLFIKYVLIFNICGKNRLFLGIENVPSVFKRKLRNGLGQLRILRSDQHRQGR